MAMDRHGGGVGGATVDDLRHLLPAAPGGGGSAGDGGSTETE